MWGGAGSNTSRYRKTCYPKRVSNLLIGVLSALMATNQPVALSNFVAQTTGIRVRVADPNDPVEQELRKLMEEDEKAHDEVDGWIIQEEKFRREGATANLSDALLTAKIEQRLDPIKKAYLDFLQRHPKHVNARVAYASFIGDLGDEHGMAEQLEKAREIDPTDPAIWNNLANHYGHRGPVKKSFEYYAKAIELAPGEPVYVQNMATTVFLFRTDAKEYYNLTEQQVFDRALELYEKAMRMDPKNFVMATDLAHTYYGIQPPRTDAAIKAWNYALELASDDVEREGIYLHLARVNSTGERFEEARKYLNLVTNENYAVLRGRVATTIDRREAELKGEAVTPAEQSGKK